MKNNITDLDRAALKLLVDNGGRIPYQNGVGNAGRAANPNTMSRLHRMQLARITALPPYYHVITDLGRKAHEEGWTMIHEELR